MDAYSAQTAIASRANDRLIRTKATRFLIDQEYRDNTELPPTFWWARGAGALNQNWVSGDFATWIDHEHHWRAYGVQFFRADVEDLVASLPIAASVVDSPKENKKSRRVFVVYGHDEGSREAVARFLHQLGFEPIVLHERANEGRTVIEKVEAHSDVPFVVVLLTPDDEGCEKGATPRSRPRQNVLLELGDFVGRLGRKNVCVFTRGEIEWPSDLVGVVHVPFDGPGAWKITLGKELKAAGFEVDFNKVMD